MVKLVQAESITMKATEEVVASSAKPVGLHNTALPVARGRKLEEAARSGAA